VVSVASNDVERPEESLVFHLEEAFEAFVADRETGVSSSRGSPTVAAGVVFLASVRRGNEARLTVTIFLRPPLSGGPRSGIHADTAIGQKAECGQTAGAIAEAPGRGYPPIGECWCMLTTATTARKGV